MFTYRREQERKGWHRPWPLRLLFVVVALFVGLLGLVGWSLEKDMGGWDDSGLGHHMVEEDQLANRVLVRGENNEILFEGTNMVEANEWIESQRNFDFTTPILLLVGAALLLIAGIGPSLRRAEPSPVPPRIEVHA